MHYHVIVLVEPDQPIEERIAELLDPYNDNHEVEPWIDQYGDFTTRNPQGYWDYYTIMNEHRRYANRLGGKNICPVSELPPGVSAFALVTATDGWVAEDVYDPDRKAWVDHPNWEGYFAEALSGHRDHIAVSLDCHN